MVEVATDADTDRARDGLDSLNDLRSPHKEDASPHKEAAKLSKSKKRSTDRKRKGSSWYNVRLAKFYFLDVHSCFFSFCWLMTLRAAGVRNYHSSTHQRSSFDNL